MEYIIYVINQSAETQQFWLFLAQAQGFEGNQVFANSSAYMTVPANFPEGPSFSIPVRYLVVAGAQNNPVGLDIMIAPGYQLNTELDEQWNIQYAEPTQHRPPTMRIAGSIANPNALLLQTLPYDKDEEAQANWYANQSFGIETPQGYIGMTWSPNPGQPLTLTPNLTFYVAIGDYGVNQLASLEQVANNAAVVTAPNSFDAGNEATVTCTQEGRWIVAPGSPVP